MTPMPITWLAIFALAFVGSHFLLSHPLRAPLVARMGTAAFQGVYSLVALVTLGLAIWQFYRIGLEPPWWVPGDALWALLTFFMWVASVLLVGSFFGNPALPGAPRVSAPRGVLTITRHPMMWSFALWALVHMIVWPTPAAFILNGAILILALGGSIGQDRKKRALLGEQWHDWTAQTAFVPFARGIGNPGAVALVGGTLLWLVATWAHGALGYWPAGLFHFFA